MKLENLQRANDLSRMKDSTRRYLERNMKTLEFIEKYSPDSGWYPFDTDGSLTTATSSSGAKNFVKRIEIIHGNSVNSAIDMVLPLDLLCVALKSEIKRLNARIDEIDKEIETL